MTIARPGGGLRAPIEAAAEVTGRPVRWVEEWIGLAERLQGHGGAEIVLTTVPELRRVEASAGAGRLALMAKLFITRAALVARAEIADVADLAGRPLALVGEGAPQLAETLGLVGAVPLPPEEARARLLDGRVAALLLVEPAPGAALAGLPGDRVRLLPIPFGEALREAGYYPAGIEAAEAPGLVAGRERVETAAVGTVLVALRRPEDREQEGRLTAFLDGFFAGWRRLADEDPRWRDVNLAAALPPWPRLEAAQRWLAAKGLSRPDQTGSVVGPEPRPRAGRGR